MSEEVVILPCQENNSTRVKSTQRFDERHVKLRKPVAEFALNNINDFKVRCYQIQTLTFIVNSDVFFQDVLSESR